MYMPLTDKIVSMEKTDRERKREKRPQIIIRKQTLKPSRVVTHRLLFPENLLIKMDSFHTTNEI